MFQWRGTDMLLGLLGRDITGFVELHIEILELGITSIVHTYYVCCILLIGFGVCVCVWDLFSIFIHRNPCQSFHELFYILQQVFFVVKSDVCICWMVIP